MVRRDVPIWRGQLSVDHAICAFFGGIPERGTSAQRWTCAKRHKQQTINCKAINHSSAFCGCLLLRLRRTKAMPCNSGNLRCTRSLFCSRARSSAADVGRRFVNFCQQLQNETLCQTRWMPRDGSLDGFYFFSFFLVSRVLAGSIFWGGQRQQHNANSVSTKPGRVCCKQLQRVELGFWTSQWPWPLNGPTYCPFLHTASCTGACKTLP